MTDTYNGWTNRETWATALWLGNDEGLYRDVTALVAAAADDSRSRAEAVKDYVEELLHYRDEGNDALRVMFDDIGSLWRVDWADVAEAFTDE